MHFKKYYLALTICKIGRENLSLTTLQLRSAALYRKEICEEVLRKRLHFLIFKFSVLLQEMYCKKKKKMHEVLGKLAM